MCRVFNPILPYLFSLFDQDYHMEHSCPGFVLKLSGFIQAFTKNQSGIYPGFAKVLPRIYLGHTQIYPRFSRDLSGLQPIMIRDLTQFIQSFIPSIQPGFVWDVSWFYPCFIFNVTHLFRFFSLFKKKILAIDYRLILTHISYGFAYILCSFHCVKGQY